MKPSALTVALGQYRTSTWSVKIPFSLDLTAWYWWKPIESQVIKTRFLAARFDTTNAGQKRLFYSTYWCLITRLALICRNVSLVINPLILLLFMCSCGTDFPGLFVNEWRTAKCKRRMRMICQLSGENWAKSLVGRHSEMFLNRHLDKHVYKATWYQTSPGFGDCGLLSSHLRIMPPELSQNLGSDTCACSYSRLVSPAAPKFLPRFTPIRFVT